MTQARSLHVAVPVAMRVTRSPGREHRFNRGNAVAEREEKGNASDEQCIGFFLRLHGQPVALRELLGLYDLGVLLLRVLPAGHAFEEGTAVAVASHVQVRIPPLPPSSQLENGARRPVRF